MFGWFKSNDVERFEEAENEFFRLHMENNTLKRENELLRREMNRLEGPLLRTETIEKEEEFHECGVVHVVPDGFEFEPYVKRESNLLEIKLKDTDNVPEVWYEGKRLDEFPKGLVDINYSWETTGVEEIGKQDININYLDHYDQEGNYKDRYLDMKTISHKRVGG